MKILLKYTTLALIIQTALVLLLGIAGNLISPAVDYFFELFLTIYQPFISLIAATRSFKGESAMIEPVWIGIALGIFCYSLIIALTASVFRIVRR